MPDRQPGRPLSASRHPRAADARSNRSPCCQLVEKQINGGNPAVPGDDEISTSVSRCLARPALQPLDPPAIAHFLRLGCWPISEVRVTSPERAGDSMDLVAAAVDTAHGI